jgi:hypothetical protein
MFQGEDFLPSLFDFDTSNYARGVHPRRMLVGVNINIFFIQEKILPFV